MGGPVKGPKPFIHQLHHSHSRPRDRPHSNFTDPTRCQTNLWPLCHLTPAVPDRRQKSEHPTNTPSVPNPTRFPEPRLPGPKNEHLKESSFTQKVGSSKRDPKSGHPAEDKRICSPIPRTAHFLGIPWRPTFWHRGPRFWRKLPQPPPCRSQRPPSGILPPDLPLASHSTPPQRLPTDAQVCRPPRNPLHQLRPRPPRRDTAPPSKEFMPDEDFHRMGPNMLPMPQGKPPWARIPAHARSPGSVLPPTFR